MANRDSYSGWLGGYAKSVAGSVSAFTQDILEETRNDTQDVNSLLKVANEKGAESDTKRQSLESEIAKLKRELAEVSESREVTELQLQEVGDRWRSILKEKEDEFKVLKEKFNELESEKKTAKVTTRLGNVSGEIDFSDPFMCEMEIGRLANENQVLVAHMEELKVQTSADVSRSEDSGEIESKITALQAQLRSVYIEHQNELALKDQETERAIAKLKEEYLNINDTNSFYGRSSISESERDAELQKKYSELQCQYKREQGYFKQLEQEKKELDTTLQCTMDSVSKLQSDNSELAARVKELEGCQEHIQMLEEKLASIEQNAANKRASDDATNQFEAVITDLASQLETRTTELTNLKSKLSGKEHLLSNRDKEIHQLRIALNTVQSEDFQEIRELVDSLKIQVDGYKESLKETGHKLLQSNQRIETLSAQEVELKATVSCLEDETHKHLETTRQLELQVRTKDDFISELQESCSSLRRSFSETTERLESLITEQQNAVRLSNQLKAEKLELVVDSKKVREEISFLKKENKKLLADQNQLKQKPLFYILESELSDNQMLDIKEIVATGKQADGQANQETCDAGEMRELKRKLADKSEQLRLLQGTISKLRSDREDMISVSDHENAISDLNASGASEIKSLKEEIERLQKQTEELSNQLQASEGTNSDLRATNSQLELKLEEDREQNIEESRNLDEQSVTTRDQQLQYEQKLAEFQQTADKEKTRLMSEIQRLMEETAEIEMVYTLAVSDKEGLEKEISQLEHSLKSCDSERENMDSKLAKVSENLKKALARLSVKDAKIDELFDQLGRVEKKLFESNELVEFFKSNQTDEFKAAQLGLTEVPTSPSAEAVTFVSSDVTPYVTSDVTTVSDVTELARQIEELTQKVSETEGRCGKLAEASRDKDLKIDLLQAEIWSGGDASLSEAETSKLIDQNMKLQKTRTAGERELECLKQQNLELLHQRDFYQDEATKFHEGMEALRAEANKLINEANERERKTAAELERLQEHLVKAEKTHTEDYLSATRGEQDLRTEVARLREQILVSNQSLDSVRAETSQDISELTAQLHVLSTQRDHALLRVGGAEEQAAAHQTSLTNLQIVLEQFQQDREGYAADVQDQYKRDLEVMTSQLKDAKATITELEARVSEIKLIEDNFKVSREDSKTKDERIKSLQREVSKLDVALKVAQEGLQKVRTTAEDKVERSLIKAFFTQYLTAPDNRKPEVLRLMTSVLNYTEEELESLYRNKDKKWLSNLFNPTTHPAGTQHQEVLQGQSFSELFVSFLETEANRGAIMGSRPLTSPPRRSSSSMPHQRTPSSSSYHHHRTLSATSNNSTQSLPVTSNVKENITPDSAAILSPSGGLPTLSTPLVVPASLAELLANKPR